MLHLHSIGHFHPENVIDNDFLASLDIGTDNEWIVERVGIRSRRTVLSLDYIRETRNVDVRAANEASAYTNAQTAAQAARMAIDRAGISKGDIGLVIAGGCSPQYSTPAEACTVAAELDIDPPCFDVSSACSTFAAQMQFLAQATPASTRPYVLAVQPENNTRTVNYNDRRVAVLWGDASTAAVVSSQEKGPAQIVRSTLHSDPKSWEKVKIPTGGHFEQEGRAVQTFAIRKGTAALKELRESSAAQTPEQFFFVGHQANLLVLEGICRRTEIDADHHLHNVEDYGNCGAAGAPSVISQQWDSFGPGDEIAVALVGAGLTWGGSLIRFAD